MKQNTGAARGARIAVRLSREDRDRIAEAPVVEIRDMSDSEAVLRNKTHFRETGREMIRRGVYPKEDGWNGWLGRYQKALVDAAFALEQQQAKARARYKTRDLGR